MSLVKLWPSTNNRLIIECIIDSDTIYIVTGYEDEKKFSVSRGSNFFTRQRQNDMFIRPDFIKKIIMDNFHYQFVH